MDAEPAPDVSRVTLHAGERGDWVVPWAGITVPRGESRRLVRDERGVWVVDWLSAEVSE